MRFEQLEYIAAVIRHGSLRRASEHLHISQPALSDAIRKLERELGVDLLDRHRSGARISPTGGELLPPIMEVLEAVGRLKAAAGDQPAVRRLLRVGTVNAGTASVVLPALRAYLREQPGATVELRSLQQDEIHAYLTARTLDLGLVNLLDGDAVPPDLTFTPLRTGRPVVVLPAAHPLAARAVVTVDELRREPFVAMGSGYVMHRVAHRLFGPQLPASWHVTDGAEMGKVMVAERIGLTILPDYSVRGDPLERAGVITTRPIADDPTVVTMVVLYRRQTTTPAVIRDLLGHLVARHDQLASA